jgi:hypothetical protein
MADYPRSVSRATALPQMSTTRDPHGSVFDSGATAAEHDGAFWQAGEYNNAAQCPTGALFVAALHNSMANAGLQSRHRCSRVLNGRP